MSIARPIAFRLTELHRTLGLGPMLRVVPRWLVHREYLAVVGDLAPPTGATARLAGLAGLAGLAWGPLSEAEAPAIRTLDPTLSPRELHRRWREGQTCHAARDRALVVHYVWTTTGRTYVPYLDRVFEPLDGDIFIGEGFTMPDWRRRGVTTASVARVFRDAYAAGRTRAVTFVAVWNRPSLQFWGRLGCVACGSVRYWTPGRRIGYRVTGRVALTDGAVSVKR